MERFADMGSGDDLFTVAIGSDVVLTGAGGIGENIPGSIMPACSGDKKTTGFPVA